MTSRSFLCTSLLAALALAACVREKPRPNDAAVPMDMPGSDTGMMCTVTATEDTVALCSDGCDNNGNTFADCNDYACCSVRTDCPASSVCGTDAGPMTACTGPSVPENTLALCSDGCSNDHADDTFADCFDYDCCDVRSDCPMGTPCFVEPAMPYTIAQIQNTADAMHPMAGARVTVDQAGMIALTPRVLVGSASGGTSMSCRFGIWIGAAVSGDFTAIQVQEIIPLGTATSCFDLPVGKISDMFAPGDAVTSVNNATYNEFCAGPTGTLPTACADYLQSNIFLGGTATIVRGAAGAAPTGTVVAVADLAAAAGAPGPRALALEGGLLAVEGAQMKRTMDGTFFRYSAFLPAAPTVELDILVSNFPATACVRTHFDTLSMGTTTVPSITGVLVPNFGRWTLRIRDEADVSGLTCP